MAAALQEYQESIRADVTHAVWSFIVGRETACHFGQPLVAGRITERPDDALELLNLDQADGYCLSLQSCSSQELVEDLGDPRAGRETGQRVVVRLMPNGRLTIGNCGPHGIERTRQAFQFGDAGRG